GAKGDKLTYRVYGKGFTRGPEDHPDNRNFDDWRSAQGGFRLDCRLNQRDSLTFQGDMYSEAAGQSVNPISYTPPYSVIANSNASLSGGNVMLRWSRSEKNGDGIQVQAYYDRTNRREANLADLRNTFDIDFVQRKQLFPRNHITWGLGARSGPISDVEVVSGLTFTPANRTDYLITAFLQDEITLVPDRLAVTLGTKWLRTNFTPTGLEPSARIMWTPSARQSFWAAYTHALRTPSDAEENFNLSGYLGNTADGTPIFARFIAN